MQDKYTLSDKMRGKVIRYCRRQKGMNQDDLARKLVVTVNTVCEWEKGRKPSVKHWALLADELGLPRDLLDMDLSDPVNSAKVQLALLKRQPLSPEELRILEKAIALYFGEDEPAPEKPADGQPK